MRKLIAKLNHLPLAAKVLFGVFLGILFGSVFQQNDIIFSIKNENLGQIGMLVIKALRTLATPLIFFAILDAFTKVSFSARQGFKLVAICLFNVTVAMTIGLTIMNVFKPGALWAGKMEELKSVIGAKAMDSKKADDPEAPEASLGIIKNVSYYVPSSLVKPFIYNNVISIVLFALLAGFSLKKTKEKYLAKKMKEETEKILGLERSIEVVYEWLISMLEIVIKLVPFAVFGVVAQVVGAVGISVFKFLWIFLAVILAGLFIHGFIYYPLIAWLVGKKSPRVFLGIGSNAYLTGLSINSSLGTVPITLKSLTERMGVSHASARLSACIGTNLNNDGITLYEAMTALFLTQALGIDLSFGQQLTVVFASIMAGAGIAGIPEAGLIVLPLVLSAAGLPEEMVITAIPLILPVDWILARCRSCLNVMSDMLVAILLDAFPDKN
jgi:Na+/H+-dicarboxylate symporter